MTNIAFLLPILHYLKVDGNIDYTESYWKWISNGFKLVGLEISLIALIVVTFFAFIIYQLVNFFKQLTIHKIAGEFSYRFKIKIARHIFLGEYADVSRFRQSSMSNMLLNQTAFAAEAVCRLFEYFFIILQIFTYTFALVTLSWELTLFIGTFAIIQLISMNRSARTSNKIGEDLINLGDHLSHQVHDSIFRLEVFKESFKIKWQSIPRYSECIKIIS